MKLQLGAQIACLEIVPRNKIEYGGIMLEELYTDAVIDPRPQIALVDELAYTNAPGSQHQRRYDHVLDLLAAGIGGWTTMNVQNTESLHTTHETNRGIGVRSTVPDWTGDRAYEVSLMEMFIGEMHRRMKEGTIDPAAQAHIARQNFFCKSNLTALRELTIRRTAENVVTQGVHIESPQVRGQGSTLGVAR